MGYLPAQETLQICQDLIRIDTSNFGDDSMRKHFNQID